MSVDLPAPFSPRRPRISPRLSLSEMLSFAFTGPNVLVMSRISRTAGASATPAAPSCLSPSDMWNLVDGVRDLDLAAYDVLAGLVDGVLDLLGHVAVEAPVGGQRDALLLQAAVHRLANRLLLLGGLLDRLLDGDVHALDDARQNRGFFEAFGLVRVHTDGEDVLLGGRLEEPAARVAGRMVDHVGALLDLLLADLLAPGRVVEGLGTRARVLGDDLAVGADRLDPGLVSRLELPDQRPLQAVQEVDDLLVGGRVVGVLLGHEAGDDAGEVRALLLPEDEVYDVLRVLDHGVDDGVLDVRVLRRDLGEVLGHEEADGEDRVVAVIRELGEVVGVVRRGRRLQVPALDPEALLGGLHALVGRVVEPLVPEAADVEHQRRLYLGTAATAAAVPAPAALASAPTAAATAGDDQGQG